MEMRIYINKKLGESFERLKKRELRNVDIILLIKDDISAEN